MSEYNGDAGNNGGVFRVDPNKHFSLDDIPTGGSEGGSPAGSEGGSPAGSVNPGAVRKRGRPAGSKNAGTGTPQASKAGVLKADQIAPIIFAFHMMLAAKMPEMAMTLQEANALAEAICNYLRHTKYSASAKSMDLAALIFALVTIEGMRIAAVLNNQRTRKRQEAATAASGVSSITEYRKGQFGEGL